jgi:hypothetical protein
MAVWARYSLAPFAAAKLLLANRSGNLFDPESEFA